MRRAQVLMNELFKRERIEYEGKKNIEKRYSEKRRRSDKGKERENEINERGRKKRKIEGKEYIKEKRAKEN